MVDYKTLIFAALIIPVILTSGCGGEGPISKVMKDPFVGQFMQDYPAAFVRSTYYNEQQSSEIIDMIREDCGNVTIQPSEFYLINISEGEANAIAWIDWREGAIVCSYKTGTGNNCISHKQSACYGMHVYWYDSCNNREEEREHCPNDCLAGACLAPCISHYEFKCYNNSIYWYDSCGELEEEKEHCDYGCQTDYCKQESEGCWDSDGGKNYYLKGVADNFNGTRLEDYCNVDGRLTEIYCYQGKVTEMKYTCPEECKNGACIGTEIKICSDSDFGHNYSVRGEVVNFNPVFGTVHEHDGELDAMFLESNSKGALKMLGQSQNIILGGTYNYSIGTIYIRSLNFYGLNSTLNVIGTEMKLVKDYCLGNYTIEHYCLTDTEYGKTQYKCPYMCLDGACVEESSE